MPPPLRRRAHCEADFGGRKADQARPADQLCRRFCPRRQRRSCGISDRDLLDGGRGARTK